VQRESFDKDLKGMREDSLLTPEMDEFLYGFLGTTRDFDRHWMPDSEMTYRACLARALEYAAILDTGFAIRCDKASVILGPTGNNDCLVRYHFTLLNKLPQAFFVFGGTLSIQYSDLPSYSISKYIEVNGTVPAGGELRLPPFLVDSNAADDLCTDSTFQKRITNLPIEPSALNLKVDAIRFSNGKLAWEFPSMGKWLIVKTQFEKI
jgi:hypothetical protein